MARDDAQGPREILVVIDDSATAELLTSALCSAERFDAQVRTVRDLAAARSALRVAGFDVLLVGASGPDDPTTLAAMLAGHPRLAVLVLLPKRLGDLAERFRQAGAHGVLGADELGSHALENAVLGVVVDQEPRRSGDTPSVLLVEDDRNLQAFLSTLLELGGWAVTLAGTGKQAVEQARAGSFDIILMDLELPELPGLDAARRIRVEEAAEGRPRTPMLAVSAHDGPAVAADVLAAGCDGHIAKPMRHKALIREMERVIGGTPTPTVPKQGSGAVERLRRRRLAGYLLDRALELEAMREALRAGEFEMIRSVGHRLRGSGGMYRLPQLSETGRRLSRAATDQDQGLLAALLDRLETELREIDPD